MKAPDAELAEPRYVEWYRLNHGQQFQGQLNWKNIASIVFYEHFTEVPDVSYYLEYIKTFVCKKRLQQIKRLKIKDACLKDLQSQSDIIAEGFIYGIL